MPALNGILETSLYVGDLDRSEAFYSRVLGLEKITGDDRFRALDLAGRQILLLFLLGASNSDKETDGGTIPGHDGSGRLHLAFSVPAGTLEAWKGRLEEEGVAVESRVEWPRGGHSLFFRDPDGHLLEVATPGLWPGR